MQFLLLSLARLRACSARFHFSRLNFSLALVVLASLPLADRAHAAFVDWTNPAGGWFDVGSNWNGGARPTVTENPYFLLNNSYTVSWDSITASVAPSANFLSVENGDVVFQNEQPSTQWDFTVFGLTTSQGASLTIRGLHLRNTDYNYQSGNLTIDGNHPAGSKITVSSPDGFRSDVDSVLSVKAGGVLDSTGGYLGKGGANSYGAALVDGLGSRWNNSGSLQVGADGRGYLGVSAGGVVTNVVGFIGYNSGTSGNAVVTGSGSQWNNSADLYVGLFGNGTLNVEAGGLVTNSHAYIGANSGATGAATVTGSGSRWNTSDNLNVGYFGNGTGSLTIADNGLVSVAGTTKLYSGGTLNLNGGRLTTGSFDSSLGTLNFNDGTLTVNGAGGTFNPGSGTMIIEGNTASAQPSLVITNTASITLLSSLVIGDFKKGNLTVSAGGKATSGTGFLGYDAGATGTATVTGDGSQWNNSAYLKVGIHGNGTLNVEAGGKVTNTEGYIGYDYSSTGQVTVTGSGSKWINTGGLYLGTPGGNFDGGLGTLNVNSLGRVQAGNDSFTIAAGQTEVVIGDPVAANGSLIVRHGSKITNSGFATIGGSTGYAGAAYVTGAGSEWNNARDLAVGYFGQGALEITAGGVVSNSLGYIGMFSTGQVTVNGTGSQWNLSQLFVGIVGNGTLNVQAGGTVTNVNGYISTYSGSTGAATVTGAGSKWINQYDLELGGDGFGGDGGVGMLTVSNSGKVQVGRDSFTLGGTAEMVISDPSGSGNLVVRHGSTITNSGPATIGASSSNAGTATVTGSGSQWNNSGELLVGLSGNGTLNVQTGGKVTNTTAYVGANFGSTGQVTVTGADSKWIMTGDLYLALNGNAVLNVADGGVVEVGGLLSVGSLGTLQGNGDVGGYVSNGGLVAPGNSAGALTIFGSYTQASVGTLQIELGGTTTGTEYDQLRVGGPASLDGTLNVSLINGFNPQSGFSFDILDWGSLVGTFSSITLPTLVGLTWNTSQLYTAGVLSVTAASIPGDYNNNGTVDAADYVVWRKTNGTPAGYNLWRANFGQTAGSGAGANASAAVPEPATLVLLIFAAAGWCLWRRRIA